MADITITFKLTEENLAAYDFIRAALKQDRARIEGILAAWVPSNLDQVEQFLEEGDFPNRKLMRR